MYQNLDVFRVSHAMARHAGARQAVVARNMANADTPGFKAQEIAPFSDLILRPRDNPAPRATRATHMHGARHNPAERTTDAEPLTGDPNGNTVSLEHEMLKAVDVKRQHDRAIAIYKSSMTLMRAAIGRR